MSTTDARLSLLREVMIRNMVDAGANPGEMAKMLAIGPSGMSVLLGRMRKKRKFTKSETRLRARLREYVRLNGHIRVTVSTEEL